MCKISKLNGANQVSCAIHTSQDCVEVLRRIWKRKTIIRQECIYVLYLNSNNEPIHYELINKGTSDRVELDINEALRIALNIRSTRIILAHNHTSGNCKPSPRDISDTKQLIQALRFLKIHLKDHVIITESEYFSFRENGLLK